MPAMTIRSAQHMIHARAYRATGLLGFLLLSGVRQVR